MKLALPCTWVAGDSTTVWRGGLKRARSAIKGLFFFFFVYTIKNVLIYSAVQVAMIHHLKSHQYVSQGCFLALNVGYKKVWTEYPGSDPITASIQGLDTDFPLSFSSADIVVWLLHRWGKQNKLILHWNSPSVLLLVLLCEIVFPFYFEFYGYSSLRHR